MKTVPVNGIRSCVLFIQSHLGLWKDVPSFVAFQGKIQIKKIDSDHLGYTWEWMGEEPTSWTLQQGVETEVDHGGFGKIKVVFENKLLGVFPDNNSIICRAHSITLHPMSVKCTKYSTNSEP